MEAINDENCAPEVNKRRESNLMLLTKSRRADIAELQETLHAVKPEQDPFWEARGKERTEKLVHNSVTEAIKARAKSRLYESTTAHKASTRVKAYDEKPCTIPKEIPEANNQSTVSGMYRYYVTWILKMHYEVDSHLRCSNNHVTTPHSPYLSSFSRISID